MCRLIAKVEDLSDKTKDADERFIIAENKLDLLFIVHLQQLFNKINVEGVNVVPPFQRIPTAGTELLDALFDKENCLFSELVKIASVMFLV